MTGKNTSRQLCVRPEIRSEELVQQKTLREEIDEMLKMKRKELVHKEDKERKKLEDTREEIILRYIFVTS